MAMTQQRSKRPTMSALTSQGRGVSGPRNRTVRRSGINPHTRQKVLRVMSAEDPVLALTTASRGLERVSIRLITENSAPGAPVFSNQYENVVERSHAVSASDTISLTCDVSVTFIEKNSGETRGSGSYTQAIGASVTGSNGLERDARVSLDESKFDIDRGFIVDPDFDLTQRFPARGNPGEGFYADIEVPVIATGIDDEALGVTRDKASASASTDQGGRVRGTEGARDESEVISIVVNGGETEGSLDVVVSQDPRSRQIFIDQLVRAWLMGRGITPLFLNIDGSTVYVTARNDSSREPSQTSAQRPNATMSLRDFDLLKVGYVTPNDRDDLGSDESDAAEHSMIKALSDEATRVAVSRLGDSRVAARPIRDFDEAQLGYLWSYYAAEKSKPRRRELRQLLHLMGTEYAMAYVQSSERAELGATVSDVVDEMSSYLSRVIPKTEGLHERTYLTLVVTPLSVSDSNNVLLTVSAVLHYDA